jgi:hypothetical protein
LSFPYAGVAASWHSNFGELTSSIPLSLLDDDFSIVLGPEVDAYYQYGSVTGYSDTTLMAACTAVGSDSKKIKVRPGTWAVGANMNLTAVCPNTTIKIAPGAVLSHGAYTMNVPNLEAGPYLVFSGTGAATLSGSVKEIYPEWFGVTGTADNIPIQKALNSSVLSRVPVTPLGKTYQITSKVTVPDGAALHGEAAAWELTSGTVFNCVGGITCIETINGGGPYYISGITITGGASGAIGIHAAAHWTMLDKINVIDFTGDSGIAVDNVGATSGGPDWSRFTNINVMANSAGYPITAHPLKHAFSFGTGVIGAHLERFTFLYTGVAGYAVLDLNGAHSVNISNGEIETAWISDSTDVYAAKVSESTDIHIRGLYLEQNNHGFWFTGTSLGNYNVSLEDTLIDGSYPGSGTSHWSKSGIKIDAYNNGLSISNSRIANVYGTGTDIVIRGEPTKLSITNTRTDDNVPNDRDIVAATSTAVLSAGAAVTQTDVDLSAVVPFRAKAVWGWLLFDGVASTSIYPQDTATGTMGAVVLTNAAPVVYQKVPFYLPLNGASRKLSYAISGSATLSIYISGYTY